MKELLERWAELEPGEYVRAYIPHPNTVLDTGQIARILYAVLMCCEKRGWKILIANAMPEDKRHEGWFTSIATHINQFPFAGHSSSPAEAALSAYIKALEATR